MGRRRHVGVGERRRVDEFGEPRVGEDLLDARTFGWVEGKHGANEGEGF